MNNAVSSEPIALSATQIASITTALSAGHTVVVEGTVVKSDTGYTPKITATANNQTLFMYPSAGQTAQPLTLFLLMLLSVVRYDLCVF